MEDNKPKETETYMSKTEEKITIGIIIMEIFIGLLALLTIFLPALSTASSKYEGVYTTFGGGTNGGMITQFFDFSFGNFLAYFLVIAAMGLSFARLAVSSIDNLITKIVTGALFLLGGILLILCKQMTIIHVNVSKSLFSLSFGPLLGLIACLIALIVVGVDIWFSRRIGFIKEEVEAPKPLTEEELRAQVMKEIEEEKAKEQEETKEE